MHFLLTNDDGIDAPGLAVLEQVLRARGRVTVAAPLDHHSGCGHRVTDRGEIRVASQGKDRWAIGGTPADCTRLGLLHLAPDADWVVAGVNAGGNLGIDLFMSGTVAAAREGAFFGRPSMAISQFLSGTAPEHWPITARWVERVLDELLPTRLPDRAYWNVNLPHHDPNAKPPRIVYCRPDFSHHAVSYERSEQGFVYRGEYAQRPRVPGGDVDVCFSGDIAISCIALNPQS